MPKIKVDKELCIGCQLCLSICPEVFESDNDGKTQVQKGAEMQVTKDVLEAKSSCPVKAIIVEED